VCCVWGEGAVPCKWCGQSVAVCCSGRRTSRDDLCFRLLYDIEMRARFVFVCRVRGMLYFGGAMCEVCACRLSVAVLCEARLPRRSPQVSCVGGGAPCRLCGVVSVASCCALRACGCAARRPGGLALTPSRRVLGRVWSEKGATTSAAPSPGAGPQARKKRQKCTVLLLGTRRRTAVSIIYKVTTYTITKYSKRLR
jgi:hypothetical protein